MTTRTITATPNHSAKTFTLRTSNGSKYRTIKQADFKQMLYMTSNDWEQFLKTDEYYKIK